MLDEYQQLETDKPVMSEVENAVARPERSAVQRIARNTFIGVGAQLGLKLASAVFQVLVVRQLGGAEFGEYSSVLAWAGLFSVLGDMGVTQYLAREVARDRSKTEELFWDT